MDYPQELMEHFKSKKITKPEAMKKEVDFLASCIPDYVSEFRGLKNDLEKATWALRYID